MRNVVAQQPVFDCEMEESSIPQTVQSAAKSADPKCSVRIFLERPDLIVRKTIGYCEPHRLSVLPSPQTLPIRTGPQASIVGLAKHDQGIVQQRPSRNHVARTSAGQLAQPARHCNP